MESQLAYARDRHELKCLLLDKGMKRAVEVIESIDIPVLEQIIAGCYTIQYHRCTQRTAKQPCLWQKIRSELGLSQTELAAEISKFHRLDVSKQTQEWRSDRERYAASILRPSDFKMWKMNNLNVRSLEKWKRDNPQPCIRNISVEDIQQIERTRPHRESRKAGFVEVFERFFTDRCGVKLSWEDLMCEITGSRDPRKQRMPETEKKRNKEKRATTDALDAPLFPDGTEQELISEVA